MRARRGTDRELAGPASARERHFGEQFGAPRRARQGVPAAGSAATLMASNPPSVSFGSGGAYCLWGASRLRKKPA